MAPTLLLVLLVASGVVTDVVVMVVALVMGLAFMFGLYAAWVPLMPAQLASRNTIEAGKARIAARRMKGGDEPSRRPLV